MGPRLVQRGPRWPQDESRGDQDGSRESQDGRKMALRGLKRSTSWSKMGARRRQNGGQMVSQLSNMLLIKMLKSFEVSQEGPGGALGTLLRPSSTSLELPLYTLSLKRGFMKLLKSFEFLHKI